MGTFDDQTLATLYSWYTEEFHRNAAEASSVRLDLGYGGSCVEPQLLDVTEFEKRLQGQWKSEALHTAWLKTLVAGHEAEFDLLMASSKSSAGQFASFAGTTQNRSVA